MNGVKTFTNKTEVRVNNKDIEWRKRKLKQMREELRSGQLNAFRELIPDGAIEEICQEAGYDFRERLLSPWVTIFHMISAGMNPVGSFQSAWQGSGNRGRSGSLAKARKRLPLEVWRKLDRWILDQVGEERQKEEDWRGHRMIAVDGTCVSMSDGPELAESFGRSRNLHGASRFPVARVTLALDLKQFVILGHQVSGFKTSEIAQVKQMLGGFQKGDVLVMDRHFAGAYLYVEYQRAGLEFITRIHAGLKLEKLKVLEVLDGEGKDLKVEMRVHKRNRRKDRSLPQKVCVRLIRCEAKNKGQRKDFWITTSLMDASKYPAEEIRGWYKQRWKVESLIRELKLGVGAEILRSQTQAGILKELCARIIALNLIHWLILKAARAYQKPLEQISFSAALRLGLAYSIKMTTAPAWRLPPLYLQLLEDIALSVNPFRPNRIEPRLRKREKKIYKNLRIPRAEWKRLYALAA